MSGRHRPGGGRERAATDPVAPRASRRRSAAWSRSRTSTFEIPRGSIVSIIGPNGAGKTTFFNMLTGLYKPTLGQHRVRRARTSPARRPDRIMALGVARTFQNIRLFATMSALENVMVGQHARMKAGLFGSIFRTAAGAQGGGGRRREKAREKLDYVGLKDDLHEQIVDQPLLRRPAPGRDRPRAGLRAQAAAARRADGGHEPAGVRGAHRLHAQAARRARARRSC